MAEEKLVIPPEIGSLSFEQALEQLESIAGQIGNDRMPLEELIKAFEKGTLLAAHCRSRIDSLEKRIEVLAKAADGSAGWQKFN